MARTRKDRDTKRHKLPTKRPEQRPEMEICGTCYTLLHYECVCEYDLGDDEDDAALVWVSP